MPTNVWVYKCNRELQDYSRAYGDWNDVFQRPNEVRWGGSWCTENPASKNIMNERMRSGDLVLA
jgi:hypothetical protein